MSSRFHATTLGRAVFAIDRVLVSVSHTPARTSCVPALDISRRRSAAHRSSESDSIYRADAPPSQAYLHAAADPPAADESGTASHGHRFPRNRARCIASHCARPTIRVNGDPKYRHWREPRSTLITVPARETYEGLPAQGRIGERFGMALRPQAARGPFAWH
jgi:hypothetical protein